MKNFKRILALVLTLMFVVGSCASLSAFSAAGKWYSTAVNWIEANGIDTVGSTADSEIDRNTFAMWIAKIESTFVDDKLWDDKVDSTSFADVKPGDHYYAAIAYAEESGFIQGDGDGNFYPDRIITFAEACAIITRVMGYEEFFEAYYTADHSKYSTYDEWYKANWQINYMRVANLRCKALDSVWVKNVGEYVPQHKLTKGEAAYLLYTLAHTGANVRHNGYDMGYKLGAEFNAETNTTSVLAVVKTLARKPLDGSQLKGWASGGQTVPLNNHVTLSLGEPSMAAYWAARNYDVASQVTTPYSKQLDTTKKVELQLFDGDDFTSTTITLTGSAFQQLVRKSLGLPANVDTANEEVFYLFDYVREGSVLNLSVKDGVVKALSVVSNHVVDTYRVFVSTSKLDYYLNGLANAYGSNNNNAALPSSYNAEKDVTSWNGNKLTFQGVEYVLRAGTANYTGAKNEIKVYGYEQVQATALASDGTTVLYKYYAMPTGTNYETYNTYLGVAGCSYLYDGECITAARRATLIAGGATEDQFTEIYPYMVRGNLVQLTAAQAKAQLINAAQGEVEAVFSDMDGDGNYDVAVVTEYDAFFVAGENVAGGQGGASGVKGVPSAGAVIINQTIGSDGNANTDAWTLDASKATNKVQLIFNYSDRHGAFPAHNAQYYYSGFRGTFNLGTGAIDVLSYASGYIQNVVAEANGGYYTVQIPVSKTDAETGATTVEYVVAHLPAFGNVPTTQKISYSLAGAKAEVEVNSKTWMTFITDFYKNNFAYAYKSAGKYVYVDEATGTEYYDAALDKAFLNNATGKLITAAEKDALMSLVTYAQTTDKFGTIAGTATYSYAPTEDTELDASKTYYTVADGVYTAVESPVVDDIATYYERTTVTPDVVSSFVLTADTELDAAKTYYTMSGTVFTAVATPDVADIGTYYEQVTGKTYYVLADAETTTYSAVTELVVANASTYYQMNTMSDSDFTPVALLVLSGVEGFTTDTKVITDAGYDYEVVVLDPNDAGIYKAADKASVAAMVAAWVNNKYINYVLDANNNIILAKSAAASDGRGFIVNVTKAEEGNTYKVNVATTGTYKTVNEVYYGTGFESYGDMAATRVSGLPTVAALKAKFEADPTTASILYCHNDQWGAGMNNSGVKNIEQFIETNFKVSTWADAAAKIITGKNIQSYEGSVGLKTYNVRASASTIWDVANAAAYRDIYNGNVVHDLTVGTEVTAADNFYYVTMTKEAGSYHVMRLSAGDTSSRVLEGRDFMGGGTSGYYQNILYSKTDDRFIAWDNNTGHWFNNSWRIMNFYYVYTVQAKEASAVAWPNAGIVTVLEAGKASALYLVPTTNTEVIAGKTYYAYDSAKGAYSVVAEPTVEGLATYYERDLTRDSIVTSLDSAKSVAVANKAEFEAKYTYVSVSSDELGYNPSYFVSGRTGSKYAFDVVFDTVETTATTTTYKPYPVSANGGYYVAVKDNAGNDVTGTPADADRMSADSTWTYYSFGGKIYAELEPAKTFNYVGSNGKINFVTVEAQTTTATEESVSLSEYDNVDVSSMNLFSSARAMTSNDAGFVPGYYLVKLGAGSTEYKVPGSTQVIVMNPSNDAGTVVGKTTTVKNLIESKDTVLFATQAQIALSADLKTITCITVIGEFIGTQPSETPTDESVVVFVGSDVTTILSADETGTSYIVKTDKPVYALDGSEFGEIYYEYDTTSSSFDPTDLKFVIEAGSFYKVDKNGKIIANMGSMFGTRTVSKSNVLVGTKTYNYTYDLVSFENNLDPNYCGTAVITNATADKLIATVNGKKNVDISNWNVKFIYTDMDATKLYAAGNNTNVSIAAFNEIVSGLESKYNAVALAKKVYETARDGGELSAAVVAKYKTAYEEAVAELEAAKEASLAKMDGQFWSASTIASSAIKRYLDSAKYTYGVDATLTFTYLYVDGTYYVIVPSFTK
ncbi:MAG: S-layer homology domain-containing protein [Eubacteriales bacterium]